MTTKSFLDLLISIYLSIETGVRLQGNSTLLQKKQQKYFLIKI